MSSSDFQWNPIKRETFHHPFTAYNVTQLILSEVKYNLFTIDFHVEIISQCLKSLLLGAFIYFIVDF